MSEEKKEHEPDVVDKAFEAFDHVLDVVHDRILRPILVIAVSYTHLTLPTKRIV